MKTTTISCLLSALTAATFALSNNGPAVSNIIPAEEALPTPTTSPILVEDVPELELRQVTGQAPAGQTLNPSQYPIATTAWVESMITLGNVATTTWVQEQYTQTFAPVPDQWPSPVAGNIGLGGLTKHGKRQAAPEETVSEPVVLVLYTAVVTQPVLPVVVHSILETETVTVWHYATAANATLGIGTGFVGTGFLTGVGTAASSGMPMPSGVLPTGVFRQATTTRLSFPFL